jgi:hypothetical protein
VPIRDDDLAQLQRLTNLRVLRLRATLITDKGLKHLKGLSKLRDLSLMSTKVTDAGLEQLKAFPDLLPKRETFLTQIRTLSGGSLPWSKRMPVPPDSSV